MFCRIPTRDYSSAVKLLNYIPNVYLGVRLHFDRGVWNVFIAFWREKHTRGVAQTEERNRCRTL